MVAAGLAGTSPHMISATITAISRLLFEFKGQHHHSDSFDCLRPSSLLTFSSSNIQQTQFLVL